MKLGRVGDRGREVPVVVVDDGYLDARRVAVDFDRQFFGGGGVERLRDAVARGVLPALAEDDAGRVGAPVARPGCVVCVGMNYASHAAESGSAPPVVPIIFLKPPNTVIGPNDHVTIPRGSTRTDWEVELGVVIGRHAGYLDSPRESLDHVAGFCIANDLSEREFQLDLSGGQWSKGKACQGFSPLGPWLVTPDEVAHQELGLRTWVNGELRQNSTTADQIFGVEMLVHHLSQFMLLEPGDVILTGTPEGVALSGRFDYLAPGDVVELEIDGLGRQRQQFVAFDVREGGVGEG